MSVLVSRVNISSNGVPLGSKPSSVAPVSSMKFLAFLFSFILDLCPVNGCFRIRLFNFNFVFNLLNSLWNSLYAS